MPRRIVGVEFGEDERAALLDEGVDPDDPAVQAEHQWVSDWLRCHGMWLQNGPWQ